MKTKPSFLLYLLHLLIFIPYCYADLPIHCLQSQIVGEWTLQISQPKFNIDPSFFNCGHETPDNPSTSYLAMQDDFKPFKEFNVSLKSNNTVFLQNTEVGRWTMIYNEGFDILWENQTFTSFFEYFPDKSGKPVSFCGRTLVGWYHDRSSNSRSCFRAEKILSQDTDLEALFTNPDTPITLLQPSSFLELHLSSKHHKNIRSNIHKSKKHFDMKAYLEDLNKNSDKLWEANMNSDLSNKTVNELNSLAGRKRYNENKMKINKKDSFLQLDVTTDLPREYSWKEYLNPSRYQGECGSCFIISVIQMIEARLKIQHNKSVTLSVQYPLYCSFFHQGCKGGNPYMINKFAYEFNLVPESCSPSIGEQGICSTCDLSELEESYSVSDYEYFIFLETNINVIGMLVGLMAKLMKGI